MRTSFAAEHILEVLAKKESVPTLGLLEVLLTPPPAFHRKAWYYRHFGSLPGKKPRPTERQKFYEMLSRLKHEKLIEKKTGNNNSLWSITKKGITLLPLLRKRNLYAKESARYEESAEDTTVRIISYDIPKKDSYKRFWLREALTNLGFLKIHKSVWVGKRKIPVEFLEDLERRGMLSYMHIMEVSKTGTLRLTKV